MFVIERSLRRRRADILDVGESILDVGEANFRFVNGRCHFRDT